MVEPSVRYHKLPGRGVGWSGVSRLWLAEDHLILVTSAFGFESYQRFYLRDIEALIVHRTKVRLIWNCIFGVIVAAGGACGIVMQNMSGAGIETAEQIFIAVLLWFLGVPVAVALICLLINTFRGATCAVWVQTAGGLAQLGAPVRVSAARRVVEAITPLIEQAQSQPPRRSSAMVNSPS